MECSLGLSAISSWLESGSPFVCWHTHEGYLEKGLGSVAQLAESRAGWLEGNSHSRPWVFHGWCLPEFFQFLDSVILSPPNNFSWVSELVVSSFFFISSSVFCRRFAQANLLGSPQDTAGRARGPEAVGSHRQLVRDRGLAAHAHFVTVTGKMRMW